MTNITINSKNRTIVITKAVAKEAQKFGSDAYKDLLQVQQDYPTYRVVIKKGTNKKETFCGLSFEYMKNYIETKGTEEDKNMFLELRAETDEAKALNAAAASYAEIKAWFFDTYPEVEAFQKRREEVLRKAKENKERREAALAA